MIAPCIFPGCRDDDGNPVLTSIGTCPDCHPKFHRLITDVTLDYVNLKHNMPKPVAKNKAGRGSPSRAGYGHPAEWASDTAAEIKETLFWLTEELASELLAEPPLRLGSDEAAVVRESHRYLLNNFDWLARMPMAEHAALELTELHKAVREGMGHTRMGERLPAPCPSCDVAALVRREPTRPRYRGMAGQDGYIRCANCARELALTSYDALVASSVANVATERAADIDDALARYLETCGPACAAHAAAPQRCRTLAAGHAAEPGQDGADVAPLAAAGQLPQ